MMADWVLDSVMGFLGLTFSLVDKWKGKAHPEQIEKDHLEQKWWSKKIQRVRFQRLQLQSPMRDRSRLKLQSMPFASSWMTVVPSVGQGHKLGNRDYMILLKWWLGLPLDQGKSGECPRCGQPCDPYGDHFVSCKLNKPVRRHNALRNALADVLVEVGFLV